MSPSIYIGYARLCIFINLFMLFQIVDAQSTFDIEVDGDFSHTKAFVWSPDNENFVFINENLVPFSVEMNPTLPLSAWQQFNLETGILSSGTTIWPLQPILSPIEISIFQPNDFVYVSPNAQLLAFGISTTGRVGIGNRATQQFVQTQIVARNPDFIGATALWSADSTTFIYNRGDVETFGPSVYHVWVPNPNDLSSIVTTRFDDVPIQNNTYIMSGELETEDRLFDISEDGSHTLLTARKIPDSLFPITNRSELVIWYPQNDSNNKIIESFNVEQLCNASFGPNNDQQLIILLADGQIMLYDLQVNGIKRLPSPLPAMQECRTTAASIQTFFSNNANWLAVVDYLSGKIAFLDVTRLISEPSNPILQAPIANANEDIIVYDEDNDGIEEVLLNASGSIDSDGSITAIRWYQGRAEIPVPLANNVIFELGQNHLTLVVEDNDGLIDTDELTVTVLSPNVSSLTLLNPLSNSPIANFDPLAEAAQIDLTTMTVSPLSIRANTNPATVGSVKFTLNGVQQIDNTAPYEFTNWRPTVGSYILTATPYSGTGGTGTAGTPLTRTFTVIHNVLNSGN
jgi:hypothetical protein